MMAVANNALGQARARTFQQQLERLVWTEGRNINIDYRWTDGRVEPLATVAAELVRLKVDVILTQATPPTEAAKQATSLIPIVFVAAGDPVGTGMVASLARPGGNVTGLSTQTPDLAGKRIELLREVLPGLHRFAVIGNVGYEPSAQEIREVQVAAHKLSVEVDALEIRRAQDIVPAFEALKDRAQALYVCPDALVNANHARINCWARACPRCILSVTISEREVSCPMGQTMWTCS